MLVMANLNSMVLRCSAHFYEHNEVVELVGLDLAAWLKLTAALSTMLTLTCTSTAHSPFHEPRSTSHLAGPSRTQHRNPWFQLSTVLALVLPTKGHLIFSLVRILNWFIRTCPLWCCKLRLHVVITKKIKMQWNKRPQKVFDLLNLP
jgi:hypothetical protein